MKKHPYLAINAAKITEYLGSTSTFAVFSQTTAYQNVSREEFGYRLITALIPPSVTAGFSPQSSVIVEGKANPQSHGFFRFNDPLNIGMHPYAALGTKYIYIDHADIYQHTIGDLDVSGRFSRPRSIVVNFDLLADLQRKLHEVYIGTPHKEDLKSTEDLEKLLDNIFQENHKILQAAEAHHQSLAPYTAKYNYKAPLLTKYGRLTHSAVGTPKIEIVFALLHYEKAIEEFNLLKIAKQQGNNDMAFNHGVYCVVAAAACIEAVANSLVFSATGVHPSHTDKRQPLRKMNESAVILAGKAKTSYTPLQSGKDPYDTLDALRVARNTYMHAKELPTDVDPVASQSTELTIVDEMKCRTFLVQLRIGVGAVFSQLPSLRQPIVTQTNVKWMGEMEVP
ncbi:MAG TPA: hypothetical protein VF943_02860 [Burkholderiales bacterium]